MQSLTGALLKVESGLSVAIRKGEWAGVKEEKEEEGEEEEEEEEEEEFEKH